MQNSKTNKTLFDKTPGVRDNGDLTISSIIIIVNPLPDEEVLSDTPIIKSEEQCVCCKPECYFVVPFVKNIPANKTKAFVFYASNVVVRRLLIQESSCKCRFCDRHDIFAKEEGRKLCGCCS